MKKVKRDRENAIEVLRKFFCIDTDQPTDFETMSRRLYKNTNCGAWISEAIDGDGIAVGSIVEGCDVDCDTHEIQWADVSEDSIQKAIDSIEEQADELWNEWNRDETTQSMSW
jgi:hypothetical protein